MISRVKSIDEALLESYDGYPRIEEAFQAALDESLNPRGPEEAFTAAGLEAAESIELGSEVGERIEEDTREASRRLIHAARLRRDPERYIAQFGQKAYDIMLSDCLWHVYRMIGKLSGRVYLLKAPD